MTNESRASSLRDRKQQAVRDHIAVTGLKLFVEHGFDAVTTEQIARAAEISPRTLFRYFASKEDVALNGVVEAGWRIEEALGARPVDEPAWDALRFALRVLMEQPVYPPEHLLAISSMLVSTPSLRARELEKQERWEELLLPHIVGRRPLSGRKPAVAKLQACAIIGAALACVHAATQAWVQAGGVSDPLELLDQAIEAVRG